ncbi:hypothetical protein AOA81_01115 [Methanomassiliicoccales archaeon RumEn M2]|nr:hypothetical protein AOA81_01115 [Methanomassiliicoccales archaeon RumEn M2]
MTSEFSLRYAVPGGAFLSFSVTLFTLILLPLSIFALINGLAANMVTEGTGGIPLRRYRRYWMSSGSMFGSS